MSTEDLDQLATLRERIDRQRQRGAEPQGLEILESEYSRRREAVAAACSMTVEEVDLEVRRTLHPDEADDAVIGRAFRLSVWVAGALALAVLGIWGVGRLPRGEAPEREIVSQAPVEVHRQATAPSLPFRDVTRASGVTFQHFNGAYGDKLLPETLGGGVVLFDWNGDGDADLFLVNSAPWPFAPSSPGQLPTSALYDNDGSGSFRDVSRATGTGVTLYGMGASAADFDGDGRQDLYITAVGPNRLLHNLGNRFEDVTARAGVAGADDAWSTCSTWFDLEGDGDLDLFVCNYVRWSKDIDFAVDYRLTGLGRAYGPPMNYEGSHSVLYRNEGDGTFTDVSAASGIQVTNPATGRPAGKALGVVASDLDGDGKTDLMVANDTVGNFLFHNLGDGTFEETGALWGLAYDRNGNATGAMGIDTADYRNDGEIGVVLGNFANEMTSLYLSQGDSTLFADEAIPEGVGAPSRTQLSFGILLLDLDLDGRLDLLQTNGHLEEDIAQVDPSQSYRQLPQVFWNAGEGGERTFVPVPAETTGDLAQPLVGRGSSYADLDGDGDLDVILAQVAGPPLLLRNDQASGHHWLRLKLIGRSPNTAAMGARVRLIAGGITQRREISPSRSYLSQVELPLTFGLGDTTAVERLEITWPDGRHEEVPVAAVDRLLRLEEPAP